MRFRAPAGRTIAVLSAGYLASQYGTDEWTAAFLHDADGRQRLLPVRVEACQLPRLLAAVVYIDLVGVDRATARRRLLEGVGWAAAGRNNSRAFQVVLACGSTRE